MVVGICRMHATDCVARALASDFVEVVASDKCLCGYVSVVFHISITSRQRYKIILNFEF